MAYEIVIARRLPGESWGRTLERIEQSAAMMPPRMSAERVEAWDRAVERIGAGEGERHRVNRVELIIDQPAVGIILEEHAAFVSLSHRPGPADPTTTMARVAEIVGIICEESGWGAWDQQLDRELELPGDLTRDGAEVLEAGAPGARTSGTDHPGGSDGPDGADAADEESSSPWWRFWSR